MNDLLQLVVRQVVLGIYWFFAPNLIDKLPNGIRLGCTIIGGAIIVVFVGITIFGLVATYL